MKKIISVLLAILMAFSVMTVAFAAEGNEGTETPPASDTNGTGEETPAEDEGFNYEDIPLWQIKFALKGGKIVLKIATALLKIAMAFGLVDLGDILSTIIKLISNLPGNQGGEEPAPQEPEAPVVTPEEPAVA